ncbi:MAG: ACT domain-containing protein [Christensenellales bacterium]
MKAIVSVIGRDKKGIIAHVSAKLLELDINIEDISQTIMQEYFTMIMLVSIKDCKLPYDEIAATLKELGEKIGVTIRIQHEDIFEAMHRL